MHVIVLGCGGAGAGLARALSAQGNDVVVVDDVIDQKRLGNEFDGIAIAGSPTDEDVLRKAGIDETQALVAATADDHTNVMAAQVAREVFHVARVLTWISDPDREEFYRGLGLETVCPIATAVDQILGTLGQGGRRGNGACSS
ncbi:MAG: TrkA family potassium uptake protein [Deltaproteobacteria bacterium]|nr:TrkA family potassium uptake protein [Deltaproteobacteria bacterium]